MEVRFQCVTRMTCAMISTDQIVTDMLTATIDSIILITMKQREDLQVCVCVCVVPMQFLSYIN